MTILRLELLNKKMQDDLYDFNQMVQEITVLLRSTADLDQEATIVAGKPEASFLPAETIEELFNLSLLNRPELAEYQNEIDKRRARDQVVQTLENSRYYTLEQVTATGAEGVSSQTM